MSNDGGPGKAAGLGAIGCLGAFALLAIIAVAAGGTAYIDGGGFILLLIIGAVLGLGVNAIYMKGKRDAGAWSGPNVPQRRSVDDLLAEAERDFAKGRIDRMELEERKRRAWEGRPEPWNPTYGSDDER